MPDLTTLKPVKVWTGTDLNKDAEDPLLSGLISQVSGMILSYLSRPDILKRRYTENFTGSGSSVAMLRNYPVLDIISVNVGCGAIPGGMTTGYWLDPDDGIPPGRPQCVNLNGYCFEGVPCKVVYDAGYCVQDEAHIAATSVAALAPDGGWARDEGVTYADGRVMTKVVSNPSQRQYALNPKVPGTYVFAAADAGAAVLIDYSYVPRVLEQACVEIVGERYRYRSRIGQVSQSLNGATTSSYSLRDMPDYIKLALAPFRRMVPV